MIEAVKQFFNSLEIENLNGIILYMFGAISTTVVKLHFRKIWTDGMKGENGLFEPPEIMLTILFVFFDHLFMADAFLGMEMSWYGWTGIGVLFLYGFTGRWGLEWLANMKGTTITKTTINKSLEEKTIKKEGE